MQTDKGQFDILVIDNAVYPLIYGYMQEIFGKCLPKRGNKVTWLFMSTYANKSGEIRRFGTTDVVLSRMMSPQGRRALFINYFYNKPHMTKLLPKIYKRCHFDVVFVRNHVRVGLSAYRFCKKNNIPFVYYLGYPHLESHRLAARLGYRKPRIISEIAALVGIPLRNWITRKADFVFTMSNYWKKQVMMELGVPEDRIQSLPAGFDIAIDPQKIDGIQIRKRLKLDTYPTLFYMGTITPPRDVSILIDTMVEVVKQIPETRLLILPVHSERKSVPILRQQFSEKKLEKNVVFTQPIPYERVPSYIAASHVGLSPIETIPLYNVSSPYKFAEMLGMACPVVASNTPDQAYVLNKSGGGMCVPYSADAFSDAVIYLLNHPEEAKKKGRRGRAFIEKERSYERLSDRIEAVFRKLISRH